MPNNKFTAILTIETDKEYTKGRTLPIKLVPKLIKFGVISLS